MSKFFALDLLETSLVCICYVERPSSARIHYAVRRIGRKRSEAAIIVALLGEDQEAPAEGSSGATVARGPFKTIIEAIVEGVGFFETLGGKNESSFGGDRGQSVAKLGSKPRCSGLCGEDGFWGRYRSELPLNGRGLPL